MNMTERTTKNKPIEAISIYFNKMKGASRKDTGFDYVDSLISAAGVFIAVGVICLLAFSFHYSVIMGPLGATCVLVFVAHKGPLSQPRQIIGGHILSSIAGLSIWSIFGKDLFILTITLVVVLIIMAFTKTMHPPAAASALVAVNFETGWGVLFPVVIGVFLIVFISMVYNNLFPKRQYPQYWL